MTPEQIENQNQQFWQRANQKAIKLPFEFSAQLNINLPELNNLDLGPIKPKTKPKIIYNSHNKPKGGLF